MNVLMLSGGYDSMVLRAMLNNTGNNVSCFHAHFIYNNSITNKAEYTYCKKYITQEANIILNKTEDEYVLGRNTLLLYSYINNFYKGDNLIIYFGFIKNYPCFDDANHEWLNAINNLLNVEFKGKIQVYAPLLNFNKDEVYNIGEDLKVDFNSTFSCNFENEMGLPCGHCDNCKWRFSKKYPKYSRRGFYGKIKL